VRAHIDRLRLLYWRLRARWHLQRNDVHGAMHRAWAYVHASQVSGDYYEFGVYQGSSLVSAWLSYRQCRKHLDYSTDLPFERRGSVSTFMSSRPSFYGFDTFAGMPQNDEGDDTLASGSFRAGIEIATARCRAVGLQAPELQLVPGLFADNADRIGDRPAAIVHLDCDLHASTRDALRLIGPRLVQGSVLLCDDYDLFRADNQAGQRRALREFTEASGIQLETWFAYGAASRAFLCHVNPA
jgi:O-methyltransferase